MVKETLVAIRGLVYSSGFVFLWAWLATVVRPLDAEIGVALPGWLRFAGYVLAAAGALLAGSSIALFITRGRGTPAPFDAPREFVASGPYRYVRNPMYVGASAVILGAGLVLGSPAIVGLSLFFVLVTHGFVMLYEEPALEARFGPSYRQYKARVNRWVPRRPADPVPSAAA